MSFVIKLIKIINVRFYVQRESFIVIAHTMHNTMNYHNECNRINK